MRVGGAVPIQLGPRADQREYGVCQGAHGHHPLVPPFTTRVSRTFMLTLVLLVRFLIVFVLTP